MCNEGRDITAGDTIFVSLMQNGKSLFAFCSREYGSFAQLVKIVYGMAGNCSGIAILDVRNQSQGWSCRVPLMLVPQKPLCKAPTNVSARKYPRQQELPFTWA